MKNVFRLGLREGDELITGSGSCFGRRQKLRTSSSIPSVFRKRRKTGPDRSIGRPVDQSIDRLVDQSTGRPVDQSTSRPVDQSGSWVHGLKTIKTCVSVSVCVCLCMCSKSYVLCQFYCSSTYFLSVSPLPPGGGGGIFYMSLSITFH